MMPNPEHVEIVQTWSEWRKRNPGIAPDLSFLSDALLYHANLDGVNLSHTMLLKPNLNAASLRGANFDNATLFEPLLIDADLRGATFRNAKITDAHATRANFTGSQLQGAMLSNADLRDAVFRNAKMAGSILTRSRMLKTDLSGADLTGAYVYGISAWDVILDQETKQSNLVIGDIQEISTDPADPNKLVVETRAEATITVDSLEVAQFIYLLLNNKKIRDVIDTIGKKAVLILGRFTPERKVVLDAMREALRHSGYLPILFDFEKPSNRDLHGPSLPWQDYRGLLSPTSLTRKVSPRNWLGLFQIFLRSQCNHCCR